MLIPGIGSPTATALQGIQNSQFAQQQMQDEEDNRRRQLALQLAGMFMGAGQTGMGQAFQSTQSQAMPQFGGGGIFGI